MFQYKEIEMMEKDMKKIVLTAIAAFSIMLVTGPTVATESISSLRGDQDLSAMAKEPSKQKVVAKEGGFERSYSLQPPMVPHVVDKYPITIRNNGCMKCHSKKNYQKEKSPMVGESHFTDRDGKVHETLSSRRYFCNQCHAPQMSGEPLVQNNFEGAK